MPKERIFVFVGGRRELRHHLRPIGIHLVRQNHRQRRLHPLPELQAIYLNNDFAVGLDVHKSIWRIDLGSGLTLLRGQGKIKIQRDQQAACGRR
jgi:hypothetical protein